MTDTADFSKNHHANSGLVLSNVIFSTEFKELTLFSFAHIFRGPVTVMEGISFPDSVYSLSFK